MKQLYFILFLLISKYTFADLSNHQLKLITGLDGKSSHIYGPNCFNGALFIAGLNHSKRFTSPAEWKHLLDKNCYEISSPFTGSVGRIYDENKNVEIHGYIYMSDLEVFAKHGQDKAHGYEIMSMKKMLDQYERTRECRMSNDFGSNCFHKIKYYNCKKITEDNKLQKFEELLDELLFSQETKKSQGGDCSNISYIKREEIIKEMINISENNLIIDDYKKESYLEQLYHVAVSYRSAFRKCEDRKARDYNIKKLLKTIKRL